MKGVSMCQVPSWITEPDGTVLLVTDKDAKAHGIEWNDATGHSAVRKVWPKCQGKEGEGLGKDTPKVVVDALLSGKMRKIVETGELTVTNGTWELPKAKKCGSVYVGQGASLTLPVCESVGGSVDVWDGGKLDAPRLKK
jgi:hypothetical protein